MTTDYGQTIHLPKTNFPRRAGLAKKEPAILQRWEKMGLYEMQREASKGREKFILHYGPPFANGNIHLGHVLSKTLKDVVCRSHQMLGYDAPLVPGWDCHGLPIEWKVEEDFRSRGKEGTKDSDPVEFRAKCRAFAQKWIDVQSVEFQRIGVFGDWKNPYITMDRKSEAMIAKEIHKFLLNDALYQGSKPVMWSIPEQTALAEAEIEYKDITSDTCYVKFPINKEKSKNLPREFEGASVVIWTTTPWTLPGNRAIGYGKNLKYSLIEVLKVFEDSFAKSGDKFLVCTDLVKNFRQITKIAESIDGELLSGYCVMSLDGIICHHPLHDKGYDFDVPLLVGDFVTAEDGTGFVHIAPGHGEDDYQLGIKHGIEVPQTVGGDGKYFENVPLFAGLPVYMPNGKKGPANKMVLQAIDEAGNLVAKKRITHSYPHSWRSKAPVIFRNTPQWFISMDKNDLREKALEAIENTTWYPARGKNRLGAMVKQRGDWCVSRQRVWGVPLAIFVNKETNEPLRDEKVLQRITDIFEKEGIDAWVNRPAQDFLGDNYKADDFEQVKDIIDVWFESGCTQGYVLEQRPELTRPADLYLEGSDQHRGWFQSSLLVGCGTRESAPYKAVLTHGFILDEKGYKMSKSTGNVTSPIKLTEKYGADILRLWVTGSDYTEDIKFGEGILKGHVDVYRRIRGTFCYLLGNLNGFDQKDKVAYNDLSDMDKWILHRLNEIDGIVRESITKFDFLTMVTTLHNFCSKELSAFYFDVCKDTLYCEALDSPKRRAILTVLDHVFNHLVHWLSPVLCFTTEEAWLSYKGLTMDDMKESIHLGKLPAVPKEWYQPELDEKWQKIISVRSAITKSLEISREHKIIGASLEAAPVMRIADMALAQILSSVNMAEICITSDFKIIEDDIKQDVEGEPRTVYTVENKKAAGTKCERCWKYTTDIGSVEQHPTVCARCAGIVQKEIKSVAA
ncbi:MAG: isoleucine--tRNA ligase [Alphaproteobacteria bacterium]|nr:isoleucine--tRNA ligase [Alphaproteobacteria bacterium]